MSRQKGFAPILIIILITIGILFLPIPYYEKEDRCTLLESNPPQYQCKTKGWHLSPSLWQRVSGDLQKTDSSTIQSSPAPTTDKDAEGKACGGFAGETGQFACPEGYKCEYPKPTYPDAQGKCVKD